MTTSSKDSKNKVEDKDLQKNGIAPNAENDSQRAVIAPNAENDSQRLNDESPLKIEEASTTKDD